MKKRLFLITLLIITMNGVYAQIQIGFHYKIEKNHLGVNYTISDTTKNAAGAITGITINNYLVGVLTNTTVIDNSGTYPVTTKTYPALKLCSNVLKAALSQKEKDPSGRVYIDFWGITKDPASCLAATYINSAVKLGEFFYQIQGRQKLGDVTKFIDIKFVTTEIGIATIPFKYRFGFNRDTLLVPNDFAPNVNIGAYIGRKWGSTRFYADPVKTKNVKSVMAAFFIAPMIVTVDKDNAFPSKDSIITKKLAAKTNQLGISTGIGASLTLSKDFSLGIFAGFDFGLTGTSTRWVYSGKPWIGFGFGYKLSILGDKL